MGTQFDSHSISLCPCSSLSLELPRVVQHANIHLLPEVNLGEGLAVAELKGTFSPLCPTVLAQLLASTSNALYQSVCLSVFPTPLNCHLLKDKDGALLFLVCPAPWQDRGIGGGPGSMPIELRHELRKEKRKMRGKMGKMEKCEEWGKSMTLALSGLPLYWGDTRGSPGSARTS